VGIGKIIIEILVGILIIICIRDSFIEEREVRIGSIIIGTILMIVEILLIWG
jgi:hypothetical protein